MRKEEAAEFNQNEKDIVQSIGAMKNAILVLSKHHEFLQTDSALRSFLQTGEATEVPDGVAHGSNGVSGVDRLVAYLLDFQALVQHSR